MCGIAGIMNFDGRPVDPRTMNAMTETLRHRGPDGQGVHLDGPVGLGHRRLSIIDPAAGKQPLCNEDGTVWITFNGEIYNFRELRDRLTALGHQFRTQSDTEAIVHAYEQWGTDCLKELRGMFAFAIWDARQRSLMIARDRLGIKPLVYRREQQTLTFASELQALRSVSDRQNEIDLEAVDQFLHYQYIPAPRTIFRNVRKLEPAHYIVFDADGNTEGPRRYWKLQFNADRSLNAEQWRERIEAALSETIRAHLVSDVPFGAFLSGGIDSSLVVAGMSDALPETVRTFCIGHPRPEFDERKWARFAADVCHTEFIDQVIDEDSLNLLPELVRHYGEPFADSSALPTWFVSRLASQHMKMVLSGDGGDELFAGYHAYPAILWEHRSPPSLYRRTRKYAGDLIRGLRLRPALKSPADSKYRRTTPVDPAERLLLWRPEYRDLPEATHQQFNDQFRKAHQSELLSSLQAFDLENYIPFDNLVKVDVASMYHGLEVRVPLLDHQFVETAAQMPPEYRLSGMNRNGTLQHPPAQTSGKQILKQIAESRFGSEFVNRPKAGFEVPVQHWFRGERGPDLAAGILDPSLPLTEWFEPDVLRGLVRNASETKLGAWQGWSLLILAEWCRQFRDTSSRQTETACAR